MAQALAYIGIDENSGGAGEPRPREGGGWRRGRPVEDPAKTKRWGFVTAKPSEFLVHCKGGRVLPSSGQGATCFKWPWDSVAVVPTSFQRLHFVADQITAERVGVAITGLAVYRIADPLLAYRVLNFSYPERAQEKLECTITDMLIGATRRLVANLSVDDCLRKRKAALADELLREIAPVIGGEGRIEDHTDRGWGVVLDTVEIQEVRVLSEKVFAAMQTPYRAALDQQARKARAESETQSALSEAESRRDIDQARIAADAAIAERRAEVERSESERRAEDEIRRRELALRDEEARVADTIRRHALEVEEAETAISAHEIKARANELRSDLDSLEWKSYLARKSAEAELEADIGARQAEVALAGAKAEHESAAARARVVTAENLPALATAVGQRFGEVKVTQIGSDNPFGSIAQAVASVLELARDS